MRFSRFIVLVIPVSFLLQCGKTSPDALLTRSQAKLQEIGRLLVEFRSKNGRYPSHLGELANDLKSQERLLTGHFGARGLASRSGVIYFYPAFGDADDSPIAATYRSARTSSGQIHLVLLADGRISRIPEDHFDELVFKVNLSSLPPVDQE